MNHLRTIKHVHEYEYRGFHFTLKRMRFGWWEEYKIHAERPRPKTGKFDYGRDDVYIGFEWPMPRLNWALNKVRKRIDRWLDKQHLTAALEESLPDLRLVDKP